MATLETQPVGLLIIIISFALLFRSGNYSLNISQGSEREELINSLNDSREQVIKIIIICQHIMKAHMYQVDILNFVGT